MGLTKYRLGDLIKRSSKKNIDVDNKYSKEVVRGISNLKKFMITKADLSDRKLDNFLIVPNNYFAFNRRTTRMGEKFAIAFNDSNEVYLVTNDYVVFSVKNVEVLSPSFLFIYFNRPEFDRYVRWNSWGSATELFSWDQICDIEINLPSIAIQKKYVAIYQAMLKNQEAYEDGLEDLKLACDGMIEKVKQKEYKKSLSELCYEVDIRNKNLEASFASGVNIEKRIIKSKAKVPTKNLKNYKILRENQLLFSGMQTGRDKTIRIAKNNFNSICAVSPAYTVLQTNNNTINPDYFMLWFSRKETDRYGWFISDSSIRSNLDLERFFEIEIPAPHLKVQNSIANIYRAYLERKEINEKLKEQIKSMCPILIKGAMEEASREEV